MKTRRIGAVALAAVSLLVLSSCSGSELDQVSASATATIAAEGVPPSGQAQDAAEVSIVVEEVLERPSGDTVRFVSLTVVETGAWRFSTLMGQIRIRYGNGLSAGERVDLRFSLAENEGTPQLLVERSWNEGGQKLPVTREVHVGTIVRVTFTADGVSHYVYFVVSLDGKVDVYVQDAT